MRFTIILAILAAGFAKAGPIVFPAGKRTPASQQAQAGFKSLSKGDFTLAESHFRQAIKLEPNLGSAYVGLAQLELRNDHPKLAEAHLRQAIASDPKSGSFQRSLAAFLVNQDRTKEAELAFRKAVELEPQSVPAWKELGDFLLVHQRNAPGAAKAFESALKIQRSAEVLYSLGAAHAAAKNLPKAEAALQESAQLAPGQPIVLHSLRWFCSSEARRMRRSRHLAAC